MRRRRSREIIFVAALLLDELRNSLHVYNSKRKPAGYDTLFEMSSTPVPLHVQELDSNSSLHHMLGLAVSGPNSKSPQGSRSLCLEQLWVGRRLVTPGPGALR